MEAGVREERNKNDNQKHKEGKKKKKKKDKKEKDQRTKKKRKRGEKRRKKKKKEEEKAQKGIRGGNDRVEAPSGPLSPGTAAVTGREDGVSMRQGKGNG